MGQIEKIYHGKARIKRKGRGWPGVEDSFPSSSQWGLQVPFWQLPSDPRPFSHFDTATTGFVSYRVISPRQDWWPTRPGWQATAHLYLWDRLLESNKESIPWFCKDKLEGWNQWVIWKSAKPRFAKSTFYWKFNSSNSWFVNVGFFLQKIPNSAW